jgi:hypothetical protein
MVHAWQHERYPHFFHLMDGYRAEAHPDWRRFSSRNAWLDAQADVLAPSPQVHRSFFQRLRRAFWATLWAAVNPIEVSIQGNRAKAYEAVRNSAPGAVDLVFAQPELTTVLFERGGMVELSVRPEDRAYVTQIVAALQRANVFGKIVPVVF